MHEALKDRCPACLQALEGHSYSRYSVASESNPELLKHFLQSYNAGDWRALKEIQHIDLLSDIWSVELLKCATAGIQALEMLSYYEPTLPLLLVNEKPFDTPPDVQLPQDWFPL